MSDFSFAVQQALFAVLTGDSPAMNIYDHAPDAAPFPHIEIGESQGIPVDATTSGPAELSDGGVQEFFTIHVWSRYRGAREVKSLMSRIYDLLHNRSLIVPGRSRAYAWIRNRQTMRDPDGLTRHGVITLEVIHRSNV